MAKICYRKPGSCESCEYHKYNEYEEQMECYKDVLIPLQHYKILVGPTSFRAELVDSAQTLEEAINICKKHYSHMDYNAIYYGSKLVWHVSN